MRNFNSALILFFAILSAGFLSAAEKKVVLPLDHAKRMQQGLELFKKEVRPLLVKKCLNCHGGKSVKGDFDLSNRKFLLDSGMIEKTGKESYLISLVEHREEPFMPLKEKKLSEKEITSLSKWIDLGAPYDKPLATTKKSSSEKMVITDDDRKFWSFQPLKAPEIPNAKRSSWEQNEIDQFILAKQAEKNLSPNAQVSKRVYIRRAYFDLIGLPPTPAEVEEFLADQSPHAYEKLIDRLLDSPHYGERWARHWLDIARFAESHGFEHDYDRNYAYHYRDFVIKALNQDMPYDQFLKWQLAGDELAPKNPLALMATGFLGAGVFPTQITANEVERTRYDALDDMLNTTGLAMLGLSVGCARCHDHKFDPIASDDYYRMLSTFTTTVRTEIELDLDPEKYKQEKAKFDLVHAPLAKALKEYETKQIKPHFENWLKQGKVDSTQLNEWIVPNVVSHTSRGKAKFEKLEDGSILVSGPNINQDHYTFTLRTNVRPIRSIRLEALAHRSLPRQGPGRAVNGNFSLTAFKVKAKVGVDKKAKAIDLKLTNARATHEQNKTTLSAASAIDGQYGSGWAVDLGGIGKDQAVVFDLETPIDVEGETELTVTMSFTNNVNHSIGRPRFSVSNSSSPTIKTGTGSPEQLSHAIQLVQQKKTDKLTAAQKQILERSFREQDPNWVALSAKVKKSLKSEPQQTLTKVMICSEGPKIKPVRHHSQGKDFFDETYYLTRGDTEQKGAVANQSFLQVLMRSPQQEKTWIAAPPKSATTSYRRTSLANWITDTKQGAGALAARVMANRIWQHHIGSGIVTTPNDFGLQGERPTHPELLDYLATHLIQQNWRLKPLHKQIMLSATYRQSTDFDSEKSKIDPENKLYWRRSPHRLEGEAIRDSILYIGKKLDTTMYGPGTLKQNNFRRSIYFKIKRSQLIPMMQLFDAPEALVSIGQRSSTTIAPQALLFMNAQFVRECAQSFAERIHQAHPASVEVAITNAYQIALGRSPSKSEASISREFILQHQKSYEAEKKPKAKLLALTDFTHALLSTNEFVYPN
ncbi:MAG: PSD1 and planctomycete cytochrome C domain-containing protein [Planctomycetes bacterium]|nr:PSD1 and planctomycete cytochrome C domain-containing protein [Planctomycetota bacterium]